MGEMEGEDALVVSEDDCSEQTPKMASNAAAIEVTKVPGILRDEILSFSDAEQQLPPLPYTDATTEVSESSTNSQAGAAFPPQQAIVSRSPGLLPLNVSTPSGYVPSTTNVETDDSIDLWTDLNVSDPSQATENDRSLDTVHSTLDISKIPASIREENDAQAPHGKTTSSMFDTVSLKPRNLSADPLLQASLSQAGLLKLVTDLTFSNGQPTKSSSSISMLDQKSSATFSRIEPLAKKRKAAVSFDESSSDQGSPQHSLLNDTSNKRSRRSISKTIPGVAVPKKYNTPSIEKVTASPLLSGSYEDLRSYCFTDPKPPNPYTSFTPRSEQWAKSHAIKYVDDRNKHIKSSNSPSILAKPGTIYTARSFQNIEGLKIEIRKRDRIKFLKPVSGMMHLGRNLRTGEKGLFSERILKL